MSDREEGGINLDLIFKGAILVGGFFAAKKIGEMLGIIDTKEEKNTAAASTDAAASALDLQPGNPYVAFNPNYAPAIVKAYNKKYKPKIFNGDYNMGMSQAGYMDLAKRLYEAQGVFNDDEDAVYDIFRTLTTQWQLSLLSSVFHFIYKKDLFLWLNGANGKSGFMNANEMNTLLEIIKNYPQYRK